MLLTAALMVLVAMADNHDSNPFDEEPCTGLLADDGAPLCSKAGTEDQ